MDKILDLIGQHHLMLLFLLSVISLLLFMAVILSLWQVGKLKRRIHAFTNGIDHVNVEELLKANSIRLQDLGTEFNLLKQDLEKLNTQLSFAVQQVGIVKYNAFPELGNNLSFSLALLDKFQNGVIITSIYGRDFTSLYGKPVKFGKSDYPLSIEEQEAIDRARMGEFKEKTL